MLETFDDAHRIWIVTRMIDINDYLIDQNGKDWGSLLQTWISPLPPKFTLWMVNRLGDVIATFEDESIHFLDVGGGNLERIADSRDDFIVRLDRDNNASNWLAIPLVDSCVAAGMKLTQDQCYGYRVPPMLGGGYEVDNLEPTDLSVHYGILGDLFQQTKNLPDGTPVNISFSE